jgi:hypothetical protein
MNGASINDVGAEDSDLSNEVHVLIWWKGEWRRLNRRTDRDEAEQLAKRWQEHFEEYQIKVSDKW